VLESFHHSGCQLVRLGHQFVSQRAAALGQVDVDLAPVVGVAHAPDQAAALQLVQGRARRGFHDAHPPADLALCQSVFFPDRAQEYPGSRGNVEPGDLRLQRAVEHAVGGAELVADAVFG